MEPGNDVKYCKNCQGNIPTQNFVSHSLHCEKNIQLCRLCKEPVPRIELTTHLEEYHKVEVCDYCSKPFELWKMKDHQTVCIKRPVLCKYCEIQIPYDAAYDHEVECGSRTEKCCFCDAYVMLKYKDNHPEICQNNKHPKRMISCEYCSLELPDDEYKEHVLNCGSRTERCNTCGKFVRYKDKRNHDEKCEKNDYLETVILCKHCELEISYNEYPDHELNCKFHWVKCSICNDFFSRKQLKTHIKECEQVKNNKMKSVWCQYCEVELPPDELMNHENYCNLKVEQCYRCSKFVKVKDFDFHRKHCSKDNFIKDVAEKAEADYSYIEYAQEAEYTEPITCNYCSVEFPSSCFSEHLETCGERIEMCSNCMNEIKCKEKVRHNMTCKKVGSSDQECPICYLVVSSEELKSHYDMCIAVNSENFSEKALKETYPSDNPESMDFTESYIHSKNTQISAKSSKSCPYCSDKIIERLFENHKRFCQKALKVCPLCEEIFHIENEQVHTEACPALKRIENSESSFTDLNNPYILRQDTSYRQLETKYKNCPHCDGKIVEHTYEQHIKLCVKELKKCNFCKEKINIAQEQEHLRRCMSIPKDKFAYPGFADIPRDYSKKQQKGKKYQTCSYCHDKILKENFKLHSTQCVASHTGAKQKRPDMKEEKKPGIFGGFFNKFWPKENANFVDQQDQRKYPYDVPEQMQSAYPRIEAPLVYSTGGVEDQNPQYLNAKIPCEFCYKKFLFDEIIEHESGCRPDLVSLPQNTQDLGKNLKVNTNREWLTQDSIQEKRNFSLQNNCINNSSLDYEILHQGRKSKPEQENYSFMNEFHKKYPESNSLPPENPMFSKDFYSTASEDERTNQINAMKKFHISDNYDRKDQKFNHSNPLDFKNDPSEFALNASNENYIYTKNMDKKYNKKNYLYNDTVNESMPKKILSPDVLSHVSSYSKAPKSEKTIDYVKGKELPDFTNETQEECNYSKQMNLYDNESKGKFYTASSVTNESCTIDNLNPSRIMTKPGEFLNKTVHVEQYKSASDVSPLQSRKFDNFSITGEDILKQDKVRKLYCNSTWRTIDADVVELSQQKHHCYQKPNHESAEISAIGTVKISDIDHSAAEYCSDADGTLDNLSNVKPNDIRTAKVYSKIDSHFTRSESGNINKNYKDDFKSKSKRHSLEMLTDDALDGSDYSIISSSEIKGALKIDRLMLKRKQDQPSDATEDNQQNQGVSADQDNRFSDKQKKLLRQQKFNEILNRKIDMNKINLDVIKPWIAKRITDMFGGIEDDVVVESIFNQLETEKFPDARMMQVNLIGFMNSKNARDFMAELWTLLISAEESADGIPAVILEQKKDEIKKLELRNIMAENHHYVSPNQSSNYSLKNEHQNSLCNPDVKIIEHQHPNITSLNSNSDLIIENSNEIFLNKQLIEKDNENNESSYDKFLTKSSDPQMNDLSVMHVRGKNYHEFNENDQSETKDNNLDSYFQFISSDADNLRIKSCNVCGKEMCLCDIKKSIDSAGRLTDSARRRILDEKSEDKDSSQFYEKTVSKEAAKNKELSKYCSVNDGSNEEKPHIWKWRERRTESDSE